MGENTWIVAKNSQQLPAPLTNTQVAELIRKDTGAEYLIWREGMEQWADPREVTEVAVLLSYPEGPAPTQKAPDQGLPRAAPVSSAGKSPGGVSRQLGFLRSLFDLRFDAFITPRLISTFYVLGMIMVGITFIALLFSGFTSVVTGIKYSQWGMVFMGLLWVILSPVLSIIYLAFVRMFFELVIVLFKIKDGITTLAEKE